MTGAIWNCWWKWNWWEMVESASGHTTDPWMGGRSIDESVWDLQRSKRRMRNRWRLSSHTSGMFNGCNKMGYSRSIKEKENTAWRHRVIGDQLWRNGRPSQKEVPESLTLGDPRELPRIEWMLENSVRDDLGDEEYYKLNGIAIFPTHQYSTQVSLYEPKCRLITCWAVSEQSRKHSMTNLGLLSKVNTKKRFQS